MRYKVVLRSLLFLLSIKCRSTRVSKGVTINFTVMPLLTVGLQHFSYFQFLDFPSLNHSIVVASRFSRVGSVFASVIHITYSFLCELLNFSNCAFAFLSLASA